MNTGKRILSVLMCIAMLISMMSTFAFADTTITEDAGSGDATTVDVNTLTGAKPTTDVAAPAISANVFVVDSTATAETAYVLEWEGQQYADMFVLGTNLFTTLEAAQAAAPVGATYIVKSLTYETYGPSGGKTVFSKAGNYYTEAYNTMPFVVGTAFDGSDWTANEEYAAKAEKLNGVDFTVTDAANSGDFNIYGFMVEYGSYAFDFNNTTVALNVNIQNTCYIPLSTDDTLWINANTFCGLDAAAASNIQFKNFYLAGSTNRFASEYLPNYLTIDGLYIPADVDMGGSPYLKQGKNSKASHFVFKNWNIQNEDLNIYFQGNNTKNYFANTSDGNIAGASGNKNFRAITIENCTLNNSAFYTLASRFIYMYANSISMHNIKGNRLINTTGTPANIFVNNSTTWGNYLSVDCQNNYFQGYVPCEGFASNNGNSTLGITIKDNYLSDGVSEVGSQLYIKSTNASNDWYASDWYLDAAMTLKASDLIAGSKVRTNGIFSQKDLDLLIYTEAGTPASISVDNATVAIADADTTALAAGTYTMTVTKTVNDVEYTIPYDLTVVEYSAPLINTLEEDTGLIDADKILFVDASANDVANGSLVEVEWKGTTYSAVKGITVFATLGAAQTYAKANAIDTPNFLIKSEYYGGVVSGETEWNTLTVTTPGKYFTQNYDKKPYVASDRALDPTGSEWASNVNTGEADSFNTADGIEVKWFSFNSAVAGKYEIYGFTITNCIQDDAARTETIDVLFQNLYIPKAYTNALFTTASSKFSSYATAKTYSDKMYLKDVYFDGSNNAEGKKGFFQSGDTYLWAYTTLDGVFADFAGYVDGGNHWINHYYDDHSFVLKNSNFRNAQEKIMFQGDNGKGANVGTNDATNRKYEKTWIADNNIFYNYTWCTNYTAAFAYIKQAYHTTMRFDNNFVFTGREDKAVTLFSGTGGDYRQPNTFITIDNNTLLGVNNSYNINRWVSTVSPHNSRTNGNFVTADLLAAEDVLAGNVTSTGKIFILYSNNHSGGVKNYTQIDKNAYLDYAKTIKASEVTGDFKAYVPDGGFYVLNNDGTTINAKIYLPSTISAADITINDMSPVWYDTEGTEVDATEITKDSVNVLDGEGNVVGANYVLTATAYVGDDENMMEASFNINVNVVPNTIDAYGASTYEKIVVSTDENGKDTIGMEHPTEKETIEDMPHISGGLIDDYAMINSLKAVIIDGVANYPYATTDPLRYSITNGEYKQFDWNGTTYLAKFGETFYQNVDTAYTNELKVGNNNPEYLLSAGEWSWVTSDGFYGGTSGKYVVRSPGKYFTENYGIDPYYPGDEFGNDWMTNIGTEFGMFNPDAYIKAAYVTIDNTSAEGRYELYGFTIGIGVKDERTASRANIDMFIKNAYFSCEGGNNYIYSTNEATNTATMNNTNDSLYIQNSYIASKGNRSFIRNTGLKNMTFDAVYADFAENTKTNTSYFHQTYDESSLVIKNSFFTNTLTDLTFFEGYNGGTTTFKGPFAEGKKSIVLENNIFKDYSFNGTGSFLNVKGGYLSEIVIRGNYIDNTGNAMTLINGIDSYTGVDAQMNLVVEDNTLIGFNGVSGYGTRALTETSAIQNNYTSDVYGGIGIALTTTDGTTAGAYYLDAYKEVLSTDIAIESWVTEGVVYDISGTRVVVTKETGIPTVADIVANGEIAVYSDEALENAIDDIAQEGTSYVKVFTTNSNGDECAIVYEVAVLGTSDNMFKDVYVAPETDTIKTPIDPDKAVIIDYATADAAFGTVVTVSWMGTEYDFIKGVTAFATLAEFETYMNGSNLENPSVLMKTITASGASSYADLVAYGNKAIGEFNIRNAGYYYTENYNIAPYTVTDGVWAKNDAFDPANGIAARWIKVNNYLEEGTVELYGFSVTAAFQNTGENSSGTTVGITDLYVENGMALSTAGYSAPRAPFMADSYYVRTQGNAAAGSMIVKNVYVSSDNARARTLLPQANFPATYELDGIFVDNSQAELYDRATTLDEYKIILDGDSSVTIKNCKASGARYSTRFVILTEEFDDVDNEYAIVFDNNIFEDITFGGDNAFIEVDGDITKVQLTNNSVINSFDTPNVVDVIEYYEFDDAAEDGSFAITANNTVSTIDLEVIIENNLFEGFGNKTVVERDLAATSSIDGNYTALIGFGGKALTIDGDNIVVKDANLKVDAEGTLSASEIYGMTINGEAFDTDGQSVNVEVRYNRDAIILSEYLVNKYNVVVAYSDAGMTKEIDPENIDINATAAYLKVMSPDESVVETRTVLFGIGEAPDPAVESVSATLYNDITMNFKTVGTDVYENVYVNFTVNNKTTKVTDSTVDGDYIVFSFENLAPHLIADTITVEIYGDVGDTAEVIGTYETTMADYLYGIKEAYVDNYELYKLAIDILNYGAAAQQYKGHNTDNLANANLTEDEQYMEEPYVEDNFEIVVNEEIVPLVEWKAIGLYLDEAIDMKLAFTTEEDIANLKAIVKDAEGNVVEEITSFVNRGGRYYIYFDGFNVSQVDEVFTFEIADTEGTVLSDAVNYSVQSYAYTAITNGGEALQNVVKTMMNFGRSALAYVEVNA